MPVVPSKTRLISWWDAMKIYRHPRALTLFFMGFSAGLPLMLLFSSLSFWLREADVSRATIGFFSWIGLAYSVKWIWSPLVDRLPLPVLSQLLGRRRSWLLLSQIAIVAGTTGHGLHRPNPEPDQNGTFCRTGSLQFCNAGYCD